MRSFPTGPGHEFSVTLARGLTLVRGRGSRVWDDQGRSYLDGVAGHGSLILGHAHPRLTEAISRQAAVMTSCPVSFGNDVRQQYLAALAEVAPPGLNRAFLCNSGTESVEAALKFARFATGRPGFVSARRGFHGRTFGAMSATFNPLYRRDFTPGVPGFAHVGFGNEAELDAAVTTDTAAVILEVVQGEGGVHPGRRAYFRRVRELCTARGALLILDEVQTGFGRTGRLFACQHMEIVPDILCLAKGIAGGFPMGAVLCADHLEPPLGRHGSTFGGNPLACAAALATLRVLTEEDLPARAATEGARLHAILSAIDSDRIVAVRSQGLMIGVQLADRAAPTIQASQRAGILALPAGRRVVRFLPALNMDPTELEQLSTGLAAALTN